MPSSPLARKIFGSWPRTRTVPWSEVSSPAIMRSSVDLPQPEGPITATNAPRAIFNVTGASAWMVPAAPAKLLLTPSTLRSTGAGELLRGATFRSIPTTPLAGTLYPPLKLIWPIMRMQRAGHDAAFAGVIGQMLQPSPDTLLLGWVPALSRAQFFSAECRSALAQAHGAALLESPHAR